MYLQALIPDIEVHIQQSLPQYIEDLRHLCSIDSNSHFKPGLDKIAVWLMERLRSLGMSVTVVEHENKGNDVLAAIQGKGRGKVLLLGHHDTVCPVGAAEARPMRIEGDTIYGPGACDMKGGLLSAIYAIETLMALGYHSFGEIRLLTVSDEEVKERHSEALIQQACHDCQGVLVLEAARPNGDIVSSRKGIAWYTLTAQGRPAHAGTEPENGRNAIVELAHQILKFHGLNGWRSGITINPGVISGGMAANVVPDAAEVQFDLRYLCIKDRVAIEEEWQKLMQQRLIPDVQLALRNWHDRREPMVCTPDNLKLATYAQQVAKLLGFSLNHVCSSGTSDANLVASCGIPVLDGLGPVGGADHSSSEYLLLTSVSSRTALLAGLIAMIGA